MKNPFMTSSVNGRQFGAVDANSRISMVADFDKAQCNAALKVNGLQSTVRQAIERRLRQLNRAVAA